MLVEVARHVRSDADALVSALDTIRGVMHACAGNVARFLAARGVSTLVAVLRAHSRDGGVMYAAGEVIVQCAAEDPASRQAVVEAGGVAPLLCAIRSCKNYMGTIGALCHAAWCVVCNNDMAKEQFGELRGFEVLVDAIQTHMDNEVVVLTPVYAMFYAVQCCVRDVFSSHGL